MRIKIALLLFVIVFALFGVALAKKVGDRVETLKKIDEDGKARAAEQTKVTPPKLVKPVPNPGGRTLQFTATLMPEKAVDLAFKLPGRVTEITARRGDSVTAGQLLARFDEEEIDAQLSQANAAIKVAQAQKTLANENLRWSKKLNDAGVATEQQLSLADTQADVSGAGIAQAKASLLSLDVLRDEFKLIAPIDGVVVTAPTSWGFVASPGIPIFRIEQISTLRLVAHVPEKDAVELKEGMDVTIHTQSGLVATGKLNLILPSIDAMTRRVPIEAVVPNDDHKLFAGSFVDASIGLPTQPMLLIPVTALLTGDHPSVLVVGPNNVLVRRPIDVFATRDGFLWVQDGLTQDDNVIADPGTVWRDGDTLQNPVTSAAAQP
ncbi:MAG: efflux RND transporter periplasmic adaptor subunit [Myxococcales bacterium]|nr:efflux RND transporter periplasmic adaptor subunit [Myxococcales bacterium]